MARRLYEENDIQAIASAIREKTGTSDKYKLREMAPAILDISVGSETPVEATLEDFIQGNYIGDELNFPNVTSLKPYAFAGLGVNKVSIPNVTYLGEGIFYNCGSLKQVDLNEQLVEISYSTFTNCFQLESLSLPDSVETICDQAFNSCNNFAPTALPSNLKYIGGNAFATTNIAVTKLPRQLETIGYDAFWNCHDLAISRIPASVKNVYAWAFENCTSLISITFESIPEILESNVFYGCENLTTINVPWSEDDPINSNAPWGATNATINYNYVEEAK